MQDTHCDSRESKRLFEMSAYERRLNASGYQNIAGIDEAGRGPLAGPVVASACILPTSFFLAHLNDSKQVSATIRNDLYSQLMEDPNVLIGIGIVSEKRIDEINILQATFEAMQEAVKQLPHLPDYLLIDGNQLPFFKIAKEGIVRGDACSISIAAASIIAKVTRDRIMEEEAKKWPQYGFEKHKGYGTKHHLEMLQLFGPCPLHRKTFDPIRSQIFL